MRKRAKIGEIRQWKNGLWIKTSRGWKPYNIALKLRKLKFRNVLKKDGYFSIYFTKYNSKVKKEIERFEKYLKSKKNIKYSKKYAKSTKSVYFEFFYGDERYNIRFSDHTPKLDVDYKYYEGFYEFANTYNFDTSIYQSRINFDKFFNKVRYDKYRIEKIESFLIKQIDKGKTEKQIFNQVKKRFDNIDFIFKGILLEKIDYLKTMKTIQNKKSFEELERKYNETRNINDVVIKYKLIKDKIGDVDFLIDFDFKGKWNGKQNQRVRQHLKNDIRTLTSGMDFKNKEQIFKQIEKLIDKYEDLLQ